LGRLQNVFYGIVNSENTMTELFCNFMAYKPFRHAFLKLFLDQGADSISYNDFHTQYTTDVNHSRPDMAVVNDEYEILIEVKTWDTGLTCNQPESYLDSLSISQKYNKCLVFLVPSNYTHLSEWNQRVDAWGKLGKNKVPVKKVNWDEIISIIEQNDLNLLSDRFSDFYELLKSWFKIEPVIFSSMEVNYMFSSEIPRVITKLYSIIDEVKDHCSQIYNVKKSINNEEYGIYINNREDNNQLLYIGVWYDFWKEYGCPLCFGVDIDECSKDVVKRFSAFHKDDSVEIDGFRTVCIGKDIIADEDCSKKIISLVIEELERLT